MIISGVECKVTIIIKNCRYGINHIPANERLSESCENVDDEYHVLIQCPKYDNTRAAAIEHLCRITFGFINI